MLKRRGAHFRPVPERRCRSRLTLEVAGGEKANGPEAGFFCNRCDLILKHTYGEDPAEGSSLYTCKQTMTM